MQRNVNKIARASVDDFAPYHVFHKSELADPSFYDGDWLLNLPDGRTLEFDNLAAAEGAAARGSGRLI